MGRSSRSSAKAAARNGLSNSRERCPSAGLDEWRLGAPRPARIPRCQLMLRLFRVNVSSRIAVLLASEFILIYSCYLAATLVWLRRDLRADAEVYLIDDQGWLRILTVVFCLLFSLYFHDLYSNLGTRPRELLQQVGMVAGTAFL